MKIASPEFNESLDDYLHRRKDKSKLSKSVYSSIKSRRSRDVSFLGDEEGAREKGSGLNLSIFSFFRKRIPNDEEVAKKEHEKKLAQERAEMKDDDENIQPHTQVVEDEDDFEDYEDVQHKIQSAPKEKKEGGFMSKLFNFGSRKREENEEDDGAIIAQQQQQQNIEDLKETIKLLHKWLEKLPPERISEFKRSPDFERYKDGLRKLGLIKE